MAVVKFARTFKPGNSVAIIFTPDAKGTFVRMDRDLGVAIVEWAGQQRTIDPKFLMHAPVTVVGPGPKPLPTVCPECGGSITIDPEALMFTPKGRRATKRKVRVAACDCCEAVVRV